MQLKQSDSELIEMVLKGNRSAYALIVQRHQRNVFNVALRILKQREEAEEAAQDAFVKAFKSLSDFQKTAKFSTWLYRIVYNTALTQLRKRRTDMVSIDNDSQAIQLENSVSDFKADSYDNRSRAVVVNDAINELAEDDATVISLFYHSEQSLEEIAAIMNIEVNNVKVKLHRARLRLKQKLENRLKAEVNDLV